MQPILVLLKFVVVLQLFINSKALLMLHPLIDPSVTNYSGKKAIDLGLLVTIIEMTFRSKNQRNSNHYQRFQAQTSET